jgi:hypothetical protein
MTTMTKPSVDAERLQIVQRAARYVLSKATVGGVRFGAMDIFPPELAIVKSGTPEYAWRSQLAWTWAKAGYMHETLSGTGLNKRRIYNLLQLGREALERIATEPVLASFYIRNRRVTGSETNRAAESYRPQELLTSKNLRLVSTKIDPSMEAIRKASTGLFPRTANLNVPEKQSDDADKALQETSKDSEESDEKRDRNEINQNVLGDLRDVLGELQGLPVFFERITAVLERMNDRLVKVEGETHDQSALLVEATRLITVEGGKDRLATGKDAPMTRDEIVTMLAELTQSFLRDNPQNVGLAALLKKHEEFHVQLANEIGNVIFIAKNAAKNDNIDAVVLAESISKTLHIAIAEEVSRVFVKDVATVLAPVVREAVAQEIGPGLTPVIETVVRAQDKSEVHTKALAHASDKHVERIVGEKLGSAFDKLDIRIQSIGSGIDAATGKIEKTVAVMDQRASAHGVVVNKIIEQRFEALASIIETRLSALTPDALAMRELSDKLRDEVTATCDELKETLAAISADAQDLAERVDAVTEGFDMGREEFKRHGAVVVENFKQVSNAAQDLLDAAGLVSKEMIAMARLRAADDVSFETALAIGDAAIERVGMMQDKILGSSTALGGGLIKTVDPGRPIIFAMKEAPQDPPNSSTSKEKKSLNPSNSPNSPNSPNSKGKKS